MVPPQPRNMTGRASSRAPSADASTGFCGDRHPTAAAGAVLNDVSACSATSRCTTTGSGGAAGRHLDHPAFACSPRPAPRTDRLPAATVTSPSRQRAGPSVTGHRGPARPRTAPIQRCRAPATLAALPAHARSKAARRRAPARRGHCGGSVPWAAAPPGRRAGPGRRAERQGQPVRAPGSERDPDVRGARSRRRCPRPAARPEPAGRARAVPDGGDLVLVVLPQHVGRADQRRRAGRRAGPRSRRAGSERPVALGGRAAATRAGSISMPDDLDVGARPCAAGPAAPPRSRARRRSRGRRRAGSAAPRSRRASGRRSSGPCGAAGWVGRPAGECPRRRPAGMGCAGHRHREPRPVRATAPARA